MCYLQAVLAMKKGHDPQKVMDLLQEAVEIHFTSLRVRWAGAAEILMIVTFPQFRCEQWKENSCLLGVDSFV